MSELTIGVIGTSRKTDERRYPIHPAHLMRIPEKLREKMIFEQGYGAAFNMSDEEIAALTGGIATRSDILTQLGTVIIAKPVLADLQELKEGGTIWGYVHCVQQQAITQAALDRKLTLIAFEACLYGHHREMWAVILFIKTMKWQVIVRCYMHCN